MTWHYTTDFANSLCSPEAAADSSQPSTCSDGEPSALWRTSRTPERCCSEAAGRPAIHVPDLERRPHIRRRTLAWRGLIAYIDAGKPLCLDGGIINDSGDP